MNGGNTRKALAALLQRLINTLDRKEYYGRGGYERVRKLKIKFGNQNKVKTMCDP